MNSDSMQMENHQEEYLATQKRFQEQINNLVCVTTSFGNPFEDNSIELLVLNTRNCTNNAVIETVMAIEMIAKKQYYDYIDEVIHLQHNYWG